RRGRIVQGLLAHAIAGEKQSLPLAIPDGVGEHPVQALHALLAPLLPGVHQHLGVATGAEAMAGGLELGPQLAMVVDLPVERGPHRAGLVGHGLGAGVAVDDAQSPDAEREPTVDVDALAVGPAMTQPIGHALDERALALDRVVSEKTGQPADGAPPV